MKHVLFYKFGEIFQNSFSLEYHVATASVFSWKNSFLPNWSHLLKKPLLENFILLCSVSCDGVLFVNVEQIFALIEGLCVIQYPISHQIKALHMGCNGNRTLNHLVLKQTLSHCEYLKRINCWVQKMLRDLNYIFYARHLVFPSLRDFKWAHSFFKRIFYIDS